ncbi:hypothetical protein DL546_006363 [Coniochaeta pulveracea]|uniref:Uncharacterized protein n=1 Tax=Coniochaeta pulveracea TaxID=177199 RepID=A0A420Y863_9PEZI|nr:hypothetical protein DL546_006363 [Coniochaeta pulveracea]
MVGTTHLFLLSLGSSLAVAGPDKVLEGRTDPSTVLSTVTVTACASGCLTTAPASTVTVYFTHVSCLVWLLTTNNNQLLWTSNNVTFSNHFKLHPRKWQSVGASVSQFH